MNVCNMRADQISVPGLDAVLRLRKGVAMTQGNLHVYVPSRFIVTEPENHSGDFDDHRSGGMFQVTEGRGRKPDGAYAAARGDGRRGAAG